MMVQLYLLLLLLSEVFIVCFAATADWEKDAVLMLGNAGAGKSLLANILLKKNRFESKFQVKPVTTHFDEDFIVENGKQLIVVDIPGVLDHNPQVKEQNVKQLQKAFKKHNKQIVMCVFHVDGGRISPEDLSTFLLLHRAYKFNEKSVIFVMNGVPNKLLSDKESEREYTSQVYDIISENLLQRSLWDIDNPINIVLVPQFEDFKDMEFPHDSDQALAVRQKLIEAIDGSAYHGHPAPNTLDLSDEAIIEEIKKIKEIEDEIKRRQEQHEFYSKIIGSAFYPAIAYGKAWGESFKTESYSTWSVKDKTDALINRMCAQNAVTGFGIGLTGQIGVLATLGLAVPVAVAAEMIAGVSATVSIQVSLASAIATLYDKDPENPIVQLKILQVMLGGGLAEVFKQEVSPVAAKLFQQMLRRNLLTGANVKWLNAMIFRLMPALGKRLFVIEGAKRGPIRLAGFIPVIGPLFSGALDGVFCFGHANALDFTLFQDNDD